MLNNSALNLQNWASSPFRLENVKTEDDEGANLITNALQVHKSVLSNTTLVHFLLDLEDRYGSKSAFNKMANLTALATKPSTTSLREWVLIGLHDLLCNDFVTNAEISKQSLCGDKHRCGWIALLEFKRKVRS